MRKLIFFLFSLFCDIFAFVICFVSFRLVVGVVVVGDGGAFIIIIGIGCFCFCCSFSPVLLCALLRLLLFKSMVISLNLMRCIPNHQSVSVRARLSVLYLCASLRGCVCVCGFQFQNMSCEIFRLVFLPSKINSRTIPHMHYIF